MPYGGDDDAQDTFDPEQHFNTTASGLSSRHLVPDNNILSTVEPHGAVDDDGLARVVCVTLTPC